jgi:hypothetical protein
LALVFSAKRRPINVMLIFTLVSSGSGTPYCCCALFQIPVFVDLRFGEQ